MFNPNSSTPETALTLPAGMATSITFLMLGSKSWSLVIKNTGSNTIGTWTTKVFVHEADTNPGPNTQIDSNAVPLAGGIGVTVGDTDVAYEKITFTLTSTGGTTITYSFEGR